MTPSRLQTKLTSSEALRGITGWGEPGARKTSWTLPLTAVPRSYFPAPSYITTPAALET